FTVSEQIRPELAVLRYAPRPSVTPDTTGPSLTFDQPEPLLGQYKQINLVDCPILRLELEVSPCPVGSWSGSPVRIKSRPCRSHSYCEGVMMFQRGVPWVPLGRRQSLVVPGH